MKDIEVEYQGNKLIFSSEPYFGSYEEVREQIENEGLRPATFREIVALLYSRENAYHPYGDKILEVFKTHSIFGFTALEKIVDGKKGGLIEQDNPEIKKGRLVNIPEDKIKTEEGNDIREKYYKSLGKTDWQIWIENESYLYNREQMAVIPIVSYHSKERQLSSEERYPYTDDQGQDKFHIKPAEYSRTEFNVFCEVLLQNGKLYYNNLPLRMASFGIKEIKKKKEENK